MFYYKYLNYTVVTNAKIRFLQEVRSNEDLKQITIVANKRAFTGFGAIDQYLSSVASTADIQLRIIDGVVYLAQKDSFTAIFRSDHEIEIDFNSESSDVDPQVIIVNFVLPLYAALHQTVPMHISALRHPRGGCIVFSGDPGAGKSTIVAELSLKLGWQLLVEDNTAIFTEAGLPFVYPSSQNIRLWPDSADRLQLLPAEGGSSRNAKGKCVIDLGERYADAPETPRTWITLTWGDQNRLTNLGGLEALKAISDSLYLSPITINLIHASKLNATIVSLLSTARFLRLERRRDNPAAAEEAMNWIEQSSNLL